MPRGKTSWTPWKPPSAQAAWKKEPQLTQVFLMPGDCRLSLGTLPDNSVDSIVTDPPYALVSIVKRFGGANAAPAKDGDVYARSSAGFMGKQWDTGETAFAVEFWQECLRVLKPGGHVLAFSGSRTYHRLAVAIEDAGFEIRDQIMWLYGSGFPKSHDVSKGIDKKAYEIPLFSSIRAHLRQWRDERGMTNKDLNIAVGSSTNGCGMARHWTSEDGGQHSIPSKEQWRNLKAALAWPDCELDGMYDAVKDGAERPVVGKYDHVSAAAGWRENHGLGAAGTAGDVTAPATEAARQWQGWGTALKPAHEPIVMARKPLIGTVAQNVLEHGTGAINVGGCRVEGESTKRNNTAEMGYHGGNLADTYVTGSDAGRWPANVIHDGSDEVLSGFPHTSSGGGPKPGTQRTKVNTYGDPTISLSAAYGSSSGSAARFFYCAKASKADRGEGNTHPTVKPQALMRYLCRLVTPPGGVVLDPFAGSGSTGLAARAEGFTAWLMEREPEYVEIIKRRLTLP